MVTPFPLSNFKILILKTKSLCLYFLGGMKQTTKFQSMEMYLAKEGKNEVDGIDARSSHKMRRMDCKMRSSPLSVCLVFSFYQKYFATLIERCSIASC